MKNIFLITTLTLVSINASATLFDFKDPNIDKPVLGNDFFWDANGGSGEDITDINTSVLWVVATASGGDNALYLDNISKPNVGLGVDDDAGGSDEEVEHGESITLTFSTEVLLDSLELWNPQHGKTFGKSTRLDIFADGNLMFNNQLAAHDLSFALEGTSFQFVADIKGKKNKGNGWYMGSAGATATSVPEPGSMALLALGMIGIGIARRK